MRLIRIFDFVEDTLVRQCSNKFDIALTYSYRWLMPKILRLGIIKHECLLLHSTFRIFVRIMVNVVMGFFTRILYGLTEFVRRNPVTCLVILILAVAAPSVLVGIANFIFYVMLTILLLGVVFVLLFRYRVNKLRREMGQQGGFSQEGPRRRTYTWYSRRDEGDVKVYKTSDTPEKRINDSVGEYVEFEEVEEQNPKK